MVIDVNVDDGMLDGLAAMQKFLKIAVTEPEVSKVPFMIDSSKFDIIEAGLKWVQGWLVVVFVVEPAVILLVLALEVTHA